MYPCFKVLKAAFHVRDPHDRDNVHSFCCYACYCQFVNNPPKTPPPTMASKSLLPSSSSQSLDADSGSESPATGRDGHQLASSMTSTLKGLLSAQDEQQQQQQPLTKTSSHLLPTQAGKASGFRDAASGAVSLLPLATATPHTRSSSATLAASATASTSAAATTCSPQDAPMTAAATTAVTASGADATKELLVVKAKPKDTRNAAVQVRPARVTKSIQCKPFLVDACVSTDD